MSHDRLLSAAVVVAVVSLAVAVVALLKEPSGGVSSGEVNALRDRIDALEEEVAALRDTGNAAEGVPVKDVFSVAAMEEQMKKLRAEVDTLKKGGGAQQAIAEVQSRQERVLQEANRVNFRIWREALESNLAANGFDEEQRKAVGGHYGKLLEQLEETQLRWFRGEVDWDRTMDEVRMRSIEFYDSVERGYDADTARRVLDIAFPTPEMRRFFFSGSGQ